MQKARSIAVLALLIALTGGVPVIVYDVHRALSPVPATVAALGATMRVYEETGRALEGTAGQLTQTIAQIRATVGTLNDAAAAQKKNWLDAGADVKKTGEDTRRVVAHVDRILTHFDVATLPAIDNVIVANGAQLEKTLGSFGDSAEALGGAAKSLDAQLNNPQIPELIGHLDLSAMHFDVISDNAEAMSGDMKLAVHRMAQPPSKLHTALDVAWTGLKFGSLFIP
jgi:ABC-type transporter Mla subunit MlaD